MGVKILRWRRFVQVSKRDVDFLQGNGRIMNAAHLDFRRGLANGFLRIDELPAQAIEARAFVANVPYR